MSAESTHCAHVFQTVTVRKTPERSEAWSIDSEQDRYLYISHNKNIRSAARQLGTGDALRLMGGSFWNPNLDTITLSFAPGKRVAGVAIEKWERKLVHDRNPVFNWPMPQDAAWSRGFQKLQKSSSVIRRFASPLVPIQD
jgi:hypothetical protein